jgi:hypothetical protein
MWPVCQALLTTVRLARIAREPSPPAIVVAPYGVPPLTAEISNISGVV